MPNLSGSMAIVEALIGTSFSLSSNESASYGPGEPTGNLEVYGFSLSRQVELIRKEADEGTQETRIAPILTMAALQKMRKPPSGSSNEPPLQIGLLAGVIHSDGDGTQALFKQDPRLFYNISSPSSMFICGSQGSGKSHTLSCVLENCLTSSEASYLSNPLAGLVLHYDTFISDDGGSPCEAAFVSSCKSIKVRVLCSPTNIRTIKNAYAGLDVSIEPLQIDESNLNTKRMLDLMATKQTEGSVPLYINVVRRVLREMRAEQQTLGGGFRYSDFKTRLGDADLSVGQTGPLNQRLDTLESFMPETQAQDVIYSKKGKRHQAEQRKGTKWTHKPGSLTIVDLSCPFVSAETACLLFNVCLSIFLEQTPNIGRVIALDEAHKYMGSSSEAAALTETLTSTIRLQRHLGARIVISTQEPTISSALLDLCSITIVHRFSSPSWLSCLRRHTAAARSLTGRSRSDHADDGEEGKMLRQIVSLGVGEALLFAPSAILGDESFKSRLKDEYLKIRIRRRITQDGGKSIMAL